MSKDKEGILGIFGLIIKMVLYIIVIRNYGWIVALIIFLFDITRNISNRLIIVDELSKISQQTK